MNIPRQARWWLALIAAGQIVVSPSSAQDSARIPVSAKPPAVPASIMPPPPQSPVKFFRQLLAMTAPERENSLTNRVFLR